MKRHLKRQFHTEEPESELAAIKRAWNRHETLRLGGVSVERDALRQIYAAALTLFVEALQNVRALSRQK